MAHPSGKGEFPVGLHEKASGREEGAEFRPGGAVLPGKAEDGLRFLCPSLVKEAPGQRAEQDRPASSGFHGGTEGLLGVLQEKAASVGVHSSMFSRSYIFLWATT